jgi:hypothetical protein
MDSVKEKANCICTSYGTQRNRFVCRNTLTAKLTGKNKKEAERRLYDQVATNWLSSPTWQQSLFKSN